MRRHESFLLNAKNSHIKDIRDFWTFRILGDGLLRPPAKTVTSTIFRYHHIDLYRAVGNMK